MSCFQARENIIVLSLRFECVVEIELTPNKRECLEATSQPQLSSDDVTGFEYCQSINNTDGGMASLPDSLSCYSYAFYCRDLSALNTSSR